MEIQTELVTLGPDGTLKLPADVRRKLGNARRLSVISVGTSLVLAPIPEEWVDSSGRVLYYEGGLITRDPKIMFGTPVITGTRIPARTIAGFIQSGYSSSTVVEEFPQLTGAQVEAAVNFLGKRQRRSKKRREKARDSS